MDTKGREGGTQGLSKQLGYDLMAAAFDVHKEMGSGYLEEVYQESLEIELELRKIPFVPHPELTLHYKDRTLRKRYQPDLFVAGQIIVELKAARALAPEHEAQLLNYLRATRKRVGYLINFGGFPRLQWTRFVL